jgi:transcriptional regulator with XRE-family HTH domain
MIGVTIGKRLEHIRGDESQAAFAARLGVHKNSWGNYERDEREISVGALQALAKLGWNPLWVLTGEGDEKISANANPGAAVDTALIVARNDQGAHERRDAFISGMGAGVREDRPESEQYRASQQMRQEVLIIALQLADEALEGKVLATEKRAELVSLIYELLEEGLPQAKVLRFARAAAN